MTGISLSWKKVSAVVGLFVLVAGVLLSGYQPAQAADAAKADMDIQVSYKECENNMEQILYEDMDETISLQVIALEEEGQEYEVSDEMTIEDGTYRQITKEDGYSVVAGVAIEGNHYVVTMDSAEALSAEQIEQEIADLL